MRRMFLRKKSKSFNPYIVTSDMTIAPFDNRSAMTYFDSRNTGDWVIGVSDYGFSGCINLTTVEMINCSYISSYGFSGCTNLTNISLPNCTLLQTGVFKNCTKLSILDLPKCEYIGDGAYYNNFVGCKLIKLSLPECSYIGKGAFSYDKITENTQIYLPKCKTITDDAFSACRELYTVNFLPKCEYVGKAAFGNCCYITSVTLPECSYIGNIAFEKCLALTYIDIPKCQTIDSYAFRNEGFYDPLEVMYVGTKLSTVCNLQGPCIKSATIQSIYVPSSLVNDYKTAPNWSNYASYITPYYG